MREAFLRSSVLPLAGRRFGREVDVTRRFCWALAVTLALWPGRPVAAEDEAPLPSSIEENVVVSSDIAEDRRDPASFTDLDADAIRDLNAGQDLSTLLGETMNAYSYSDAGNGYGYSYLRIRGFDQTRIAMNVNGVPLNTPESHQVYTIDLGDFATGLGLIQIQRGPGTSMYGSPAVGGVVNLETAPLPTIAGGNLEMMLGSFGTGRLSVSYGGPIGKSPWAYAVRAAHVESNGYRTPSWSKQTFGQIAFERFDPTSVWRILLFGGPESTQLSYYGVPYQDLSNPVARRSISPLIPGETDNFFQPQLQVMNDRKIAPGLMLKNTVYAILGNGYFRQYATALSYDPLGDLPPTPAYPEEAVGDAWTKRALDNQQLGWIPRIGWSHPKGELTAGLELLFHRGRHDGTVTSGTICSDPSCTTTSPVGDPLVLYDFTNRKNTMNLFVREELRVAPTTTLNLELQATRHEFSMGHDEVRGISWDATYQFLSPRIGANWNIDPRWNVYAQATRTESEPTFNNVWDPEDPTDPASDPADHFATYDPSKNRYTDPSAKPERLTSFELGAGYIQGTTRLKMNVYRMQFRDEFVYAGGLDSDGVPITTNAGKSLHEGIEIEASGRVPGDVDLSGYVALSRDILEEDTVLSPDGAGGAYVIDYSGNRIALFPGSTARLAVARTFGPVRVELSGRRIGTIYLDNSQNERKTPANRSVPGYVDKEVDPFTLVGLQVVTDLSRAAYRKTGSLTLRLRVDNLLDAQVAQFGYSYPIDAAYTEFYSEFYPSATRSVMLGLSFAF
jgi:iron complex outermembrane receptor protein